VKNRIPVIDCDVHQTGTFTEYISESWRHVRPPSNMPWRGALGHSVLRPDATPPGGGRPGSDPAYLIEHLLEGEKIDWVILTGDAQHANTHSNSHFALAYARGYNDWIIDKWLSFDERFKGSMMIAPQDIPGSVKEVERVGDHPDIVQIIMASALPTLMGKPYFWPLYEIAEAKGLPIAIHPGSEGSGITVPTAAGYPSYYCEWHTMLPSGYMNHLVSLVCEGVFEKFPKLRIVMIEGGVAWAAPLMWRFDKNWKGLRSEVPWLKRPPSEYIKECVRFTTQPIEEPESLDKLLAMYDEIDAYNTVMFSSDYPHWDFDSPLAAFRGFPEDLKRRILYENAKELYKIGE